jgi:hypothetical protein
MEDLRTVFDNQTSIQMSKVVEHSRALEAMGCAVVVFTPEELRGAKPSKVEERLVELGWEVIDDLATEPREGEL